MQYLDNRELNNLRFRKKRIKYWKNLEIRELKAAIYRNKKSTRQDPEKTELNNALKIEEIKNAQFRKKDNSILKI